MSSNNGVVAVNVYPNLNRELCFTRHWEGLLLFDMDHDELRGMATGAKSFDDFVEEVIEHGFYIAKVKDVKSRNLGQATRAAITRYEKNNHVEYSAMHVDELKAYYHITHGMRNYDDALEYAKAGDVRVLVDCLASCHCSYWRLKEFMEHYTNSCDTSEQRPGGFAGYVIERLIEEFEANLTGYVTDEVKDLFKERVIAGYVDAYSYIR